VFVYRPFRQHQHMCNECPLYSIAIDCIPLFLTRLPLLSTLQDRPVRPIPFPWHQMHQGSRSALRSAFLDWTVQAVRSGLDTAAAAYLSERLGGKLRKGGFICLSCAAIFIFIRVPNWTYLQMERRNARECLQ
jgi:hypothetical protein